MGDVGFAACLAKPVRRADLLGSLRDSVPAAPVPTPPRPIQKRLRPMFRILLADDNTTNQQVAVGLLKKLGLRVDAVANGQEAIQALTSLPYDLVLMDVQMPELDGLAATRQIRNPESAVRNHGIPIIAMTAYAMQGDREKCLAAGMNDYLAKPVSPQALVAVLDQWLPKEPTARTIPTPPPMEVTLCPSPPQPEVQVFDRANLLERLMGDEPLARLITTGFLEDIPRQIEVLRGFLETGDDAGVARQVHTIKGASANVSGKPLCALAADMELAAHAGDLDAVRAHMLELQTQFDRLKEAMTQALHI